MVIKSSLYILGLFMQHDFCFPVKPAVLFYSNRKMYSHQQFVSSVSLLLTKIILLPSPSFHHEATVGLPYEICVPGVRRGRPSWSQQHKHLILGGATLKAVEPCGCSTADKSRFLPHCHLSLEFGLCIYKVWWTAKKRWEIILLFGALLLGSITWSDDSRPLLLRTLTNLSAPA